MENISLVKIPKTFKIKHIPIMKELEKPSTLCAINCIKHLTGWELSEVTRLKMTDIINIYREICLSAAKVSSNKELPNKITILGKEYYLCNPITQPIGWVIDSNVLVTLEKPEMLAAFMYLEVGTNYGDADENQNIKHSVFERGAIFKEEMPLDIYLALINKYAEIVNKLSAIIGNEKSDSPTTPQHFSWENLILAVGKEFNLPFHEVAKLNINTFIHYTKVLFHNIKERNKK